ncbi:MAG: PIN domain-containing protein [Bauldia sp.]
MFVLDTNVVSEMMRPVRERALPVERWLRSSPARLQFSAAPAIAEVFMGIAVLVDGRRKTGLAELADEVCVLLGKRILPFDERAARVFAEIYGHRRRLGLGTPTIDLQIAAIARVAGMAVATRNVTDFQECGVEVVDPWTA